VSILDEECSTRCHHDHDSDHAETDAYRARTDPYIEAIDEWLAHHDPLSRAAFDRLNNALARTVGDPTTHPEKGHNSGLRRADAEAFGLFAFEHDVALVELDEDACYADLHGFPVYGGQRWVPVLVTADDRGGVETVARRMHDSYHVLESILPDDLASGVEIVTDGGRATDDPTAGTGGEPAVCDTLGCENPPVENGYCTECVDISPGLRDSGDNDAGSDGTGSGDPGETNPEHRASGGAPTSPGSGREPESEVPESPDPATHTPPDAGSGDTNPGFEVEGPDGHRAREAFADAIAWFHGQIDRRIADHDEEGEHPDRPTTAREYFHEQRGWTDDTIDDARLGWAPASRTGLLDHLMREGYDREAILGTGLFTENLRPLWQGRYVLPYFDADGQPVYAISRSTGREGGGAVGYDGHPDDGLSGKYAKPAHTKEYARIEEPIFGLGSIEDGQPVLITEGIADTIAAHQAGYPCISPVTTRFKRDDRKRLREVLDDHDIPRAHVVQDAEPPSSDLDENGRLTLTQAGEGLRGALDTAAYLDDHGDGLRVAVAELPRPGLDKVDLDDYLREWATDGSLAPVLASAKPACEHPAYDPQDAAIEAATRDRPDPLGDDAGDRDQSGLFDLDIRDASGLDWDYRGASPLGHHGDSEKYFVLIEDHDVAFDHKYKAAYNALTYLLVDAGERSPDDPNGRLSDKEVFAAWLHAKQERIVPDDDPIPRRALRHVAVDHGHCEPEDIQDGWKLPRDAHDDALDTLADEHGVEPGRDPIGSGWARSTEAVDPTTLDVVLDPELAWKAAGAIGPDDLGTPITLSSTTDGDRWKCPQCGGAVDIVRAVAIHHGTIECCEDPLAGDDAYDIAYRRARTEHEAALPEYVDATTATDNWALV
jgi:hypothetical protein